MAIVDAAAKASILAQINTVFGAVNVALQAGEQTAATTARSNLATVIAAAAGYVRDNGVVEPGTLAITPADLEAPPGAGGGPCSGVGAVNVGTGTIA
jgi:hypothetical protein